MSWQTDDNDVTSITAFRLLALKIESLATTAYITDRATYSNILTVLRGTTNSLRGLLQGLAACSVNSDCPVGYICSDGTCQPESEDAQQTSMMTSRSQTKSQEKKKKKK